MFSCVYLYVYVCFVRVCTIAQGWCAVFADIDAIEGVTVAGPISEGGGGGRPRVLEKIDTAIILPDHQVQLPVPIDCDARGKGGRGCNRGWCRGQ